MRILALILLPMAAGGAVFAVPSRLGRRALLTLIALLHTVLTASLWGRLPGPLLRNWLAVDSPGLAFLTIVSLLFLAAAVYSVGYLKQEETARHRDREEGFLFMNEPEAVFIGCLLLFLGSMTLVCVSQHFGLLWVGIEATTLASAPLIHFHRHHRSLEATWKYLLICSVGIALALLGNFLLSVSAAHDAVGEVQLIAGHLVENAARLDPRWLKAAFLFFLVGYGTKMGLAPMHTWLPDAHSESPSLVSALLSGALLNCAFLGILRVHRICLAAGEGEFSQSLLLVFGFLSMGVAAVFVIRQADFKRMLAYSSIEHVGILAVGVGVGGAGVFGAMFHAFNHSLTKAALFLAAGNILAAFRTRNVAEVRGLTRALPVTGVLWLAGFLAISGAPPFGTFLSEFTILKAAVDTGHVAAPILFLVLLALIFIGMSNIVLNMSEGGMPEGHTPSRREHPLLLAPPIALLMCVLALGLYLPRGMNTVFEDVSRSFESRAIIVEAPPSDRTAETAGTQASAAKLVVVQRDAVARPTAPGANR